MNVGNSQTNLKVGPEKKEGLDDVLYENKGNEKVEGILIRVGSFLLEFFLDIFIVFPLYLFKMLIESFRVIKQKYDEDNPKDYKKYLKIAFAYILDIVLPLSVVGITFKTVKGIIDDSEDIYFVWQENCFVFFLSFIFMISYLYNITLKDKPTFSCSFRYLMRSEHLQTLGLGIIHTNLLKQLKIPQNQLNNQKEKRHSDFSQEQIEFNNRIQKIAKDLNIDLSLFFFDLLDNQLSKSTTQKVTKEEVQALSVLKESGIQAKLSARDKILLPIYCNSGEIEQESAPLFVFFLIICVKVVLPLWYLTETSQIHIDLLSILNISGFYMYMISILYTTMNNQDLKRRTKIVTDVSNLCNFKDTTEADFIKKLDVTCPLSLKTWDNSRRLVCQLDLESTEKFEMSYIFLGFYYVFIGLICASIYGQIYILIDKDSVYLHPIMVIHTTADFLMVTIFFFIRIYYGSLFNSNFSTQIEVVDELIGIYEDLVQTYDTYFHEKFQEKVSNPLYRKMIQQITEKSRVFSLPGPNGSLKEFRGDTYTKLEDQQLQIKLMNINKETLETIKTQVRRDDKKFRHKMFGEFEIQFKETLSTALFGFVTCAPALYNKILEIFYPEAVAPSKLLIPHLHKN